MKQADDIDFNEYKNSPEIFKKLFFEEYWEKKPLLIKNFFNPGPLLMNVLKDLQDSLKDELIKENIKAKIKGSIGTELIDFKSENNLFNFLPQSNLPDYLKSIEGFSGGKEFFIYLPSLCQNSIFSWRKSLPLLKEVIQWTSLPMKGFDIDLFFGSYKETPTMIHKDSASLKFLLSGKKRMLVWPQSTFETPGYSAEEIKFKSNHFLSKSVDEAALASAISLSGNPGDALYWPSTYWHVSYNENSEFKMSATIAWFQAIDIRKMLHQEKLKKFFFPAIPKGLRNLFLKEVEETLHIEKLSLEDQQKVYDHFFIQSSKMGVEFPPFSNFSREYLPSEMIEWGLVEIDLESHRLFLNGVPRTLSKHILEKINTFKTSKLEMNLTHFQNELKSIADNEELEIVLDFFKERRILI